MSQSTNEKHPAPWTIEIGRAHYHVRDAKNRHVARCNTRDTAEDLVRLPRELKTAHEINAALVAENNASAEVRGRHKREMQAVTDAAGLEVPVNLAGSASEVQRAAWLATSIAVLVAQAKAQAAERLARQHELQAVLDASGLVLASGLHETERAARLVEHVKELRADARRGQHERKRAERLEAENKEHAVYAVDKQEEIAALKAELAALKKEMQAAERAFEGGPAGPGGPDLAGAIANLVTEYRGALKELNEVLEGPDLATVSTGIVLRDATRAVATHVRSQLGTIEGLRGQLASTERDFIAAKHSADEHQAQVMAAWTILDPDGSTESLREAATRTKQSNDNFRATVAVNTEMAAEITRLEKRARRTEKRWEKMRELLGCGPADATATTIHCGIEARRELVDALFKAGELLGSGAAIGKDITSLLRWVDEEFARRRVAMLTAAPWPGTRSHIIAAVRAAGARTVALHVDEADAAVTMIAEVDDSDVAAVREAARSAVAAGMKLTVISAADAAKLDAAVTGHVAEADRLRADLARADEKIRTLTNAPRRAQELWDALVSYALCAAVDAVDERTRLAAALSHYGIEPEQLEPELTHYKAERSGTPGRTHAADATLAALDAKLKSLGAPSSESWQSGKPRGWWNALVAEGQRAIDAEEEARTLRLKLAELEQQQAARNARAKELGPRLVASFETLRRERDEAIVERAEVQRQCAHRGESIDRLLNEEKLLRDQLAAAEQRAQAAEAVRDAWQAVTKAETPAAFAERRAKGKAAAKSLSDLFDEIEAERDEARAALKTAVDAAAEREVRWQEAVGCTTPEQAVKWIKPLATVCSPEAVECARRVLRHWTTGVHNPPAAAARDVARCVLNAARVPIESVYVPPIDEAETAPYQEKKMREALAAAQRLAAAPSWARSSADMAAELAALKTKLEGIEAAGGPISYDRMSEACRRVGLHNGPRSWAALLLKELDLEPAPYRNYRALVAVAQALGVEVTPFMTDPASLVERAVDAAAALRRGKAAA